MTTLEMQLSDEEYVEIAKTVKAINKAAAENAAYDKAKYATLFSAKSAVFGVALSSKCAAEHACRAEQYAAKAEAEWGHTSSSAEIAARYAASAAKCLEASILAATRAGECAAQAVAAYTEVARITELQAAASERQAWEEQPC